MAKKLKRRGDGNTLIAQAILMMLGVKALINELLIDCNI
jgi:hypothetical protein